MTQSRHLRIISNISLSTTFNWSPCFVETSVFSLPFLIVQAIINPLWDCCNNLLMSFLSLFVPSLSPFRLVPQKNISKCRSYVVTLLSPQIRIDYKIFIRTNFTSPYSSPDTCLFMPHESSLSVLLLSLYIFAMLLPVPGLTLIFILLDSINSCLKCHLLNKVFLDPSRLI